MSRIAWILLAACGGTNAPPPSPDAPDVPVTPTDNPARGIDATGLVFDVGALSATAMLTFAPSESPGATLEVGDLTIASVKQGGVDVAFAATTDLGFKPTIILALPASADALTVEIAYAYKAHENFDGASAAGFTFLWPYYCSNLFPCHTDPSDGGSFTLDLTGVPAGKTAIFPTAVAADAPSYQVAWSIDTYTELALGTTTAGTQVVINHRAGEAAAAQQGGANLVKVFDWYEKTIGPYRFGTKVGTVSVAWPAGAFGGMEHHPLWHISSGSLNSEETNAHEAAHGWFGDGIRIGCWEDFVLSEGTVTYLAGRALEVVAPAVGAATWQDYETQLGGIPGAFPVWPQSCNSIDILEDNLFTNAPYIRGAFFYRSLAQKLGAEMVDQILAAFYAAHAGKAATMAEMLATIQTVAGYDATACADKWLRSTTKPTPGACP